MRKLHNFWFAIVLLTAYGAAASNVDNAIQTLLVTRQFQQAAISPDGKHVAYVQMLEPTGSALYVADTGGGEPARRVTLDPAEPHSESDVAWSPDGSKLAFLSDAESPGQLQLYVAEAATLAVTKLTSVKGFLALPGWSPDGNRIAVLFTQNATRVAGPLVAETPQTGEIKEAVTEQRLAVVVLATHALVPISPADMYVYEYDWSPDGTRFVVTAARGNGDNNWYIAQLYTLDANGAVMKSIYKPPLQIAIPVWSPDGREIAFVGGLMSDEPSVGGDIFTIHASGGIAQNLTPELKGSVSWLTWTRDGKILFAEYVEGDAAIARLDPATRKIDVLWRGAEELTAGHWGPNVSLAHDGRSSAAVRDAYGQPPEVWAGPIGEWKQITHENAQVKPSWGEARSLGWKNDGFDVQGWLLYPSNFDPKKKYPLVVVVHGGPGFAVQSHWPSQWDYEMGLPADGYFLLLPNPRGSFGQGEAFTRANVKDFGYGDFRDIMAGVDEALRLAPVDPDRLGLTGWSYGGFMTMWGVTQTRRFKAAMAGAGISDWQSYYGENLIDQWMIPFFGASVYDDPAVYARSSPMTFIKNVKTPTLIQVGDSDGECPAPQSYEFWHALKTLAVETQLVVYEHEGHGFVNPKHHQELMDRTAAWFDAHLK